MRFILFDDNSRLNLLPFTYTRPVSEIRIGILKIKDKWVKRLPNLKFCGYKTESYLQVKYSCERYSDQFWINGSIIPSESLINSILSLNTNQSLFDQNKILIAFRGESLSSTSKSEKLSYKENYIKINNLWDIFQLNYHEIISDFKLYKKSKISINNSTKIIGEIDNIYVDQGSTVNSLSINTENGPVFIGKNCEIMEGSMIRGPVAICDNSKLMMGAKIYGSSTVGPFSKVSGEVNNTVFFGYSNKSHDGYIGNSVIGEWCNLGAGTNNSNLKNNYSNVKLWSYLDNKFINTNNQFIGLFMGDHSKCAINSVFNTGSVLGINSSIQKHGFIDKFIPSYIWLSQNSKQEYELSKSFDTAEKIMARRKIKFSIEDQKILTSVFLKSKNLRKNYL